MSTTDGPRGDEEREQENDEESVLPPGPRRSTYTPPTGAVPNAPGPDVDDDVLAAAMADDLTKATTGTVNVLYQLDDVAPNVPLDIPVEPMLRGDPDERIPLADAAPAPAPTIPEFSEQPPTPAAEYSGFVPSASAEPQDASDSEGIDDFPVFEEPTFDERSYDEVTPDEVPYDEPEAQVVESADERFDEPADDATDASAEAEASSAPEEAEPAEPLDEAAQLAALASHAAPAGRPWIPERQSMRDDELAALVQGGTDGTGGTLEVMEELERQLQLRKDESREFQEWQESMLAVGTPEALAAVDKVAPQFTDLVPPPTTPISTTPPPPATAAIDLPPPVSAPEATPAVEDLRFAPPPAAAPSPSIEDIFNAPPPPLPEADPFFDAPRPQSDQAAFDAPPPSGEQLVDAPPPADQPSFDAPPPVVAPSDLPSSAFIDAPPPFAPPASGEEVDAPPPLVEPPPPFVPPALPDAWDIPQGNTVPAEFDRDEPADLVEPAPFGNPFVDQVFTGSVPVITGSVQIPAQELDVDDDDPVDPTDQAPAFDDLLGAAGPLTAPVEPILSPRIPEDEVVLGTEQELERPRVFSLELSSLEPTPQEQRIGRAARMFWLWFASNSSVVSLAFGAMLFSLGMSLRQAIVGVLAGIAVSFIPLGLGSLAGKRSGQPTMVVSRAAFGTTGNIVPALISLISRVFWGAVLLWFLAQAVAAVLVGAEATGGLSHDILVFISLGVGFAIALVVALFGYGLIARVQLVVTILATVLVIGLIALTWSYVDFAAALTFADGSWTLAVTAAVLVFSFVGLLWANSSGDLARYQRPESSGAGTMLFSSFGATIPAFLLISYGTLLAASNPQVAGGLMANPLDTLGRMLPVWYPVPLIAATALSLLSGVIVTTYSGGFSLQAIGLRFSRSASVVLVGVLTAAVAVLLVTSATDFTMLFRDLATTLAVPVAAWAGIFAADTMIRNRRYHTESLLKPGGIYPTVNWVNLPMLVLITVVGLGLTTATIDWLSWQGYLFTIFGLPLTGTIAGTDLGVFVALILGLITPIIGGIPAIRRQESAGRPAN